MLFRQLDCDGDWTFGKGKNNFAQDIDALKLNLRTRLYSWVGDCFFDVNAGIDWYNRLGSRNQRELLELDLRTLILQTENVTGIISFDTILNERKLSVSYSIETIYGQELEDEISVGI